MSDVAEDLMVERIMPVLDVPKVGYDNTVWSEDKRMLTIGKTVQVSPDMDKENSDILSISGYGQCHQKVA